MKFIHAADLHLDSPLRNLENYDAAPVDAIRGASRQAFEKLVDLACQEQVSLVLLAGDIHDNNWNDFNTGLFFNGQLSKLNDANIKVVWLVGNHDAGSEITKSLHSIKRLANVHYLSERRPETIHLTELGIAVHGQSFANKVVSDNLAKAYPKANPNLFNIGLLHTSLDGRPGHDSYAPCKLDDLLDKGYNYWALGHIHKQEIIYKDPWIAFSGNIQGRHIRETGAKGCLLISVENGSVSTVESYSLDVIRWRQCVVDVSGAMDEDAILDLVSSSLIRDKTDWEGPEAIRIELTGTSKAHDAININQEQLVKDLRAHASNISVGNIWLEKVKFKTQSEISSEQLKSRSEALGLQLHELKQLNIQDPIMVKWLKDLDKLKSALPIELKSADWLQLNESEIFAELRDDAINLLWSRLISK